MNKDTTTWVLRFLIYKFRISRSGSFTNNSINIKKIAFFYQYKKISFLPKTRNQELCQTQAYIKLQRSLLGNFETKSVNLQIKRINSFPLDLYYITPMVCSLYFARHWELLNSPTAAGSLKARRRIQRSKKTD